MFLTKATGILGPIANILGYVMNAIFVVLDKLGIPNSGLAIILFTIVVNMALMPLTIRQQRYAKLQNKMMPEIRKIQEKYKGRKDNDSVMRQNEEIQAVYKKYGTSATGSCVQLLIQMPILFALYRVIYNMPAYVTKIKEAFAPVVNGLLGEAGATEYLQGTQAAAQFSRQFTSENFINNVGDTVANTYIDVLNRFSTGDWDVLKDTFASLGSVIDQTTATLARYNSFLGLNMGNSPWYSVKDAWGNKQIGIIVIAVMIPVLSALTQWLSVKMTPQSNQETGNEQSDNMMRQMKTMNTVMPIMSAYFCFTLPAGMGLYWIAGAVIRTVQMIFINHHIDKMDIDAMIAKNQEKMKRREERRGGKPTVRQRMSEYAAMSTRGIETEEAQARQNRLSKSTATSAESEKALEAARAKTDGKYRSGSLAAKANMVREYNETTRSDKSGK